MAKFLPNTPVSNDEMEEYLGKVVGSRSRAKSIILRSNGIKKRYYAIDKNGKSTHTNAEMTAEAVKGLENDNFSLHELEMLACGTGSSDQLVPGHSSMVHGLLCCNPVEIISPVSTCNSGMGALKFCYMSVKCGNSSNAIATGSEKSSTWLLSKNFEEEVKKLHDLQENKYLAFEKDFLRWMLSDAAGAALLQNKPDKNSLSLKIKGMRNVSYANELETCMYGGCIKDEKGNIIPWSDMSPTEYVEKSVFTLKQDIDILSENIVGYGVKWAKESLEVFDLKVDDIDYFLPHMSSFFFKEKIFDGMHAGGIGIPYEKWFTNLEYVGNTGAASSFLMLEELFNSGKLKKGNIIFLSVPESARFSYVTLYLEVV
jgi:3-oxoacyl-[acyl-carrier-protein] synthase-3